MSTPFAQNLYFVKVLSSVFSPRTLFYSSSAASIAMWRAFDALTMRMYSLLLIEDRDRRRKLSPFLWEIPI